MPGDNNQGNDNKIIEAAVNLGLAVEKANEASNPAILDIIARGEQAASLKNLQQSAKQVEESVAKGVDAAWDTTKSVSLATKKAVVGIGENWWDSYTKRSALAELVNGEPKQPTATDIAAANAITQQLSLENQGIESVARTAFHLTTAMPVCTDKAVLRCSFGVGVGPLTVLPMNRTQIGTPPNYVANIMDFLPVNMPQFGMCFNILNPAVASATAIATAAAGGKFTLVPMPCIGTRAPTPWLPTTKNTCGKISLLTQTSCSTCWGIGSISILHCGQGLTNTYRFLVPGADGSVDLWATAKVGIESLLNLAGGVTGGLKVLSGLTKGISNAFKAAKMKRLAEGTKKLSEGVNKISESKKLEKALEVIDYGGNSAHLGMSIKDGDTAGATGDAANIAVSLAFKGRAKYKAHQKNAAFDDMQKAGTTISQTEPKLRNSVIDEGNARVALTDAKGKASEAGSVRTQTQTELRAKEGEINQETEKLIQADQKVANNQVKYNEADAELTAAKEKQTKANQDLEQAKANYTDAQKKLEDAKATGTPDEIREAQRKELDTKQQLTMSELEKSSAESNLAWKQSRFDTAKSDLANSKTELETAHAKVEQKINEYGDATVAATNAEMEWSTANAKLAARQEKYDAAVANTDRLAAQKAEAEQAFKNAGDRFDYYSSDTTGDKIASNVAGWGKDPAKSVATEVINDDGKKETEGKEKVKDEFDKYM